MARAYRPKGSAGGSQRAWEGNIWPVRWPAARRGIGGRPERRGQSGALGLVNKRAAMATWTSSPVRSSRTRRRRANFSAGGLSALTTSSRNARSAPVFWCQITTSCGFSRGGVQQASRRTAATIMAGRRIWRAGHGSLGQFQGAAGCWQAPRGARSPPLPLPCGPGAPRLRGFHARQRLQSFGQPQSARSQS